jgi:hypothetical protein
MIKLNEYNFINNVHRQKVKEINHNIYNEEGKKLAPFSVLIIDEFDAKSSS